MQLELISFKICPFVQRSAIVLHKKQMPFEVTYIDLHEPPAWFAEISPLGKVPILKVNNRDILFESAVIAEFINEISGDSLHPSDPLQRAQHRAWIELSSACLNDLFDIIGAPDEMSCRTACAVLHAKLDRVETALQHGPFFVGTRFSLVDAAFAPLFMRMQILHQMLHQADPVFDCNRHAGTYHWSDALLQDPEVQQSVVEDLPDLYLGMVRKRDGFIATLLP